MAAKINGFKQALQRDALLIGCWLGFGDPYAAEITAGVGYDWLVIDGEHAPNDIRSIMAQLQVVDPSSSHAVVRLPVGETWMIKQALDIGAQTLLIPMVESAAQAHDLVAATRYPPGGRRGVGAVLGRASGFSGIAEYDTTADAQICLIVQVESRAGLAALNDILMVDGVDGVFIGPADLAADMGHHGHAEAPEVQQVICDALQRIRAAGVAPGVMAFDHDLAQRYRAAGARFIATDVDLLVMVRAVRDRLTAARSAIA